MTEKNGPVDPDSERLPLVQGGQGRSGQSTAEHAAIVCLCLAACVACVVAVFCWGRFERSKEPRKADVIQIRQ